MSIPRVAAVAGLLLASASSARADGAAVFQAQCAKCHGEHGKSDTAISKMMKIPPLAGDARVAGMTDAQVSEAVKSNDKHPPTLTSLSPADIDAASTFAKALAAK